MDLCYMFDSRKNLIFLDISQSFLSTSLVKILCEKKNRLCYLLTSESGPLFQLMIIGTSTSLLVAMRGQCVRSFKEMTKTICFLHSVRSWDTQDVTCTISGWYLVLLPFINELNHLKSANPWHSWTSQQITPRWWHQVAVHGSSLVV